MSFASAVATHTWPDEKVGEEEEEELSDVIPEFVRLDDPEELAAKTIHDPGTIYHVKFLEFEIYGRRLHPSFQTEYTNGTVNVFSTNRTELRTFFASVVPRIEVNRRWAYWESISS